MLQKGWFHNLNLPLAFRKVRQKKNVNEGSGSFYYLVDYHSSIMHGLVRTELIPQ